jgi:iron complex outermembrane recepter protein
VARPVGGLSASIAGSYTDTRIASGTTQYDIFGVTSPGNLGGESFPNVPKWQINGDISYEHGLSDSLVAFARISGHYASATNGGLGDYAILDMPSYVTIDLRGGVAHASDRWRISVFARNITNEFYLTGNLKTSDSIQRFTGMPRTFGVSLSIRVP